VASKQQQIVIGLSSSSSLQMGTEKESFIELTERIGRKTGGLSVYPFTSSKRGSKQPVAYVMVSRLGITKGIRLPFQIVILTLVETGVHIFCVRVICPMVFDHCCCNVASRQQLS
jgi:Zn-dependent M16 (insulinase) family peptidase